MGRTPRLLNPDDGPLQAFAHDLRMLREKAGNPTYRALAKTAGFSASTLGEAAGGVRRPSLDVTLAFVGACGGDVEAWQERWYQLDRQLTAEQLEQAGQGS
ncbi:helix-turn-helix transcriptional regulator, partial [Actinocrinis sp.]|uniref:helix-turn-helix domain-containing protein n=1 Tax=Actinocrinis sp. TaxID=1920516 RepID=UPI002D732C9A